ncbi:MAG TPA: hypothetical protein VFG18_00715 [Xanthomonadaceae bacterium]|nr:hypothetical protein [Xanthomonadaceae bacterium]
MIRRLLFPALAASVLAGCVTGYQYRAGPGDYYYGQPEVEYRGSVYYGSGYPYGYGYYGYGNPYGYGYYDPYWGPWWGWGWYRGGHHGHGHGHDHDHDHDDDGDRPPWRNIGILPDRGGDQPRLRQPGSGGAPGHPTLPPRRVADGDPPRVQRPSLPPRRAGIGVTRPMTPTLPARQAGGDGLRPMAPSLPARRVDVPTPARPVMPARRVDADPPRRASPSVRSNPPERELRRRKQP